MMRSRIRRSLLQQSLFSLLLCALWIMLWDEFSVLNVITGLLLGFFVTRVFYLPAVELSGRFNLFYGIHFVVWFTLSMLYASVQVSWKAVRPRGVSAGSVIAMELHTRSDLLITFVSLVIGLIPGSIVIDTNRARSIVYVHVLDCATDEEVQSMRSQIYKIEHLLIGTLGSVHDITTLNDWRTERGEKPILRRLWLREREVQG